jgi:hypothetical protein
MDEDFSSAVSVVSNAYVQKYGTALPIDLSEWKKEVVATVRAHELAGLQRVEQRKMELIRGLVEVVDKRVGTSAPRSSQAAPDPRVPSGATPLTALPSDRVADAVGPVNSRVQDMSMPSMLPMARQPTARAASFVACRPVAGAALHATLPLGISTVYGMFMPVGGLNTEVWPCIVLEIEDTEGGRSQHVPLLLARTSAMGFFYRSDTAVQVGPVAAGASERKCFVRGCMNKEIHFGVSATVQQRVMLRDAALQRRFHRLSIESAPAQLSIDVDTSTLVALDDKGEVVGSIVRAQAAEPTGGVVEYDKTNDEEAVYILEVETSGSGPGSVCISGAAPHICLN